MPAEKKSKIKPAKKNASTGTAKKNTAPVGQSSSGSNNTAFFMLIIVILITIIVLMLNRFYDKGALKFPDLPKWFQSAGEVRDKKSDVVKDVKDKKSEQPENNISVKPEKDVADVSKQDVKGENSLPAPKDVYIYLLKLDEKTERIYLNPVKRTVTEKDILASTLEDLIKGPTQKEKEKGFITAVPPGLKIRSIAVNGKTAEIDFNSAIEDGAAGDILIKRVQQIVYTSTQFDSINSIIIRINGQRRKSLGGDGFSISGSLKR